MFRYFAVILLTVYLPFSVSAQTRTFNDVSIVALIVTSGGETPVSASVTNTLESLDAQTLTANAPNASEMRSILKRFTSAAIDTDIAIVYFDGAVLKIGDREFVAPGGIQLRRPSDLLTRAIPLSALARATALANNGGVVLAHSTGQSIDLIEGVTLVETAPRPRSGTSPILFANENAAVSLASGLETMANTDGDIDLTEALQGLSAIEGISISALPSRPAMLRQTPPLAPEVTATTTNPVLEASPEEPAAEGLELPQVGSDPEDVTPLAETDSASEETIAEEPADTPVSDPVPETEALPVAENTAPQSDPVNDTAAAEESELSIDVLRAMQGALTRTNKRTLQRNLRNLGFYRGLIDGIFGRQTERAISAYQDSIGATVTGVLTPAQLEALSE